MEHDQHLTNASTDMREAKRTSIPVADALILLVALTGMLLSIVMAAWGIAIAPNPLHGAFKQIGLVTLIGTLPIGAVFVLRQQAFGAGDSADYSGCPRWMQLACYATFVAGLVLFFLPAVLQFCGVGPVFDGSQLPSTVPGGFGLLAYTSIFGQTYSSVVQRRGPQSGLPL